jgi:hypothetical protein
MMSKDDKADIQQSLPASRCFHLGVMQSAIYKIVDMVTMRRRFMSAVWTVYV